MDCSCIEAILKWMNLVDNNEVVVNADSIGGIPLQDAEVLGDESWVDEPGEEELNEEEPYKNETDEEELHDTELQKEIEHPGESNQVERTEAANGEMRQKSRGPDCFQEDGDGHLSKSESIKSHQHSQLVIKRRSPDFQDAPFDMDPLVARAYHNLTKSWLLQFQTDILLLVMEQLEDSDLLRLRRTCRRFMILFGFKTFEKNHHDLPDRVCIWREQEVWQSSLAAGADKGSCTPDELLKEIFCSTCFTARKSRSAGGPTPELNFLHCGGCGNHHQAQAFSATQSQVPPRERICIGREGRFNLCEHVSLSWNDLVKTWESGETKVVECNHPSHDFARNHYRDQSTEKPKAELISAGQGIIELLLRKETHISLDKQDRDRPTAQQLRRRLREIERISPCPWYPLDSPRISPMRLVDPNFCQCLEYEGADRIDWHLRGPRDHPGTGTGLRVRCWSRSKTRDNPKVCDAGAHLSYIESLSVSADLIECYDGCARLYLKKYIRLGPQGMKPWAGAWYRALDPLSYELPDFYGVTWCMSKQCRNYIKHRWNHNTSFNILDDGKFDRYRAVVQDCDKNCDAWDDV